MNIQDVFTYFDNSAINSGAQVVINSLLQIVREDTTDDDVDVKLLLNYVKEFNNQLQSAVDDTLMRSKANYSSMQTAEKKAICDLIAARINMLEMILSNRC